MGLKLKEEQDLGVIVKKEATGIMVTNKGHKTMIGNMGDTLMQRVDRSTYVLTKEEVAERNGDAGPKETAAQKKAREKAEAAAKKAGAGAASQTPPPPSLDLNPENGGNENAASGDAGAAE